MVFLTKNRHKAIAVTCAIFAFSGIAWSAGPQSPDAGRLMKQLQELPIPRMAPTPTIEMKQLQTIPPATASQKVLITRFQFTGATVFGKRTLADVVRPFEDRELTMAQLQEVAETVRKLYVENGYFLTQVYLPRQDITGGIVQLAIVEAKAGKVEVAREGDIRIASNVLRTGMRGERSGALLNDRDLMRDLLVLNDLPGLSVRADLKPGTEVGTTDIFLKVKEGKPLSFILDTDNYGTRYTGEYRAGGTVALNDMTSLGDQLVLRGMSSGAGMNFGRGQWSIPVSSCGTVVGVSGSYMVYDLRKELKLLDANGYTWSGGVFMRQPLYLSPKLRLYATAGYDHKGIKDELLDVAGAKKVDVGNAGITMANSDSVGTTTATAFAYIGKLGLDSGLKAIDLKSAGGADTAGVYSKLRGTLSRTFNFSESTTFSLLADGQVATNRNLDSSEEISLGGASGVRAYPSGEASGDDGVTSQLELRQSLKPIFNVAMPGDLQLIALFDAGYAKENHEAYGLGTTTKYRRQGAGGGLALTLYNRVTANVTVAWKVGKQPAVASDGSTRDPRASFQLITSF